MVLLQHMTDAYVKVPDGSLGAYLPNLDLSKPFKNSGDTKWGGLRVIDNAQKLLTYHGVNSWDKMYAYVVSGTAITESRFPTTFENGDKILSGWNTSKDGTGNTGGCQHSCNRRYDAVCTVERTGSGSGCCRILFK